MEGLARDGVHDAALDLGLGPRLVRRGEFGAAAEEAREDHTEGGEGRGTHAILDQRRERRGRGETKNRSVNGGPGSLTHRGPEAC